MEKMVFDILTKIKQFFCEHISINYTVVENPSPLLFLDINAKCDNCGLESQKILRRAYNIHKTAIADEVLFKRNVKKFPEYYKEQIKVHPISPLEKIIEIINSKEEE